jgi:hypothetical protein
MRLSRAEGAAQRWSRRDEINGRFSRTATKRPILCDNRLIRDMLIGSVIGIPISASSSFSSSSNSGSSPVTSLPLMTLLPPPPPHQPRPRQLCQTYLCSSTRACVNGAQTKQMPTRPLAYLRHQAEDFLCNRPKINPVTFKSLVHSHDPVASDWSYLR